MIDNRPEAKSATMAVRKDTMDLLNRFEFHKYLYIKKFRFVVFFNFFLLIIVIVMQV